MKFASVFIKLALPLGFFSTICIVVTVTKGFDHIASIRVLLPSFTKLWDLSNSMELKESLPSYEQFLSKCSNNSGNSKLTCNTCAVVTNSGMLLHGKAGKEVDSDDCVIRMNNAPTNGYEEDVGTKTTFRFFDHSSAKGVIDLLKNEKSEKNATVLILIPDPEHRAKNIEQVSTSHPNSILYCYGDNLLQKAVERFENETGKPIGKTWLSCGWVSIVFAREICGTINIYGMVEESYCEQVFSKKLNDTRYHYFDNPDLFQCAVYINHKNWDEQHKGSHKFMKEKGIFRKWAEESGNINFYQPHWNITSD